VLQKHISRKELERFYRKSGFVNISRIPNVGNEKKEHLRYRE
jgi:hypothetical protein